MKQGRSLTELAMEIERRAELKSDYVADSSKVKLVPENRDYDSWEKVNMEIDGIGDFEIADHAHSQLSGFTQIPKTYYDRMKKDEPSLLALNVNHWLKEQPGRRLIRTLKHDVDPVTVQEADLLHPPVTMGQARAWLSDRYRIMDNEEVAEAILPVIFKMGDIRVESCEVTDSRLYLKVIFPWLEDEVEKEGRKVGDVVQAGICLGNSEIGMGSTFVEPMIFRLSCLNGARMRDHGMKKFHLGRVIGEGKNAEEFFKDDTLLADDRAFLLKLRDVVRASADQVQFKLLVDKMSDATREKIEGDPVKVVEQVSKKYGFNDPERFGVLKNLIAGGDLSKYGLMNAITAASQEVEDYDRASDLEKIGGDVIELNRSEWKTIAIAA